MTVAFLLKPFAMELQACQPVFNLSVAGGFSVSLLLTVVFQFFELLLKGTYRRGLFFRTL